MEYVLSLLLAFVVCLSVNAQTWPAASRSGKFSVRSASTITAVTKPTAAPVDDTSANLDVLLTASSNTLMNVDTYLDNGSGGIGLKVSGTTVTAKATPQVVHVNVPLNVQWVKVSGTVAITNTTVSATIIQSK
ncbi:hypothetical protein [Bradyrhizobium sp. cf659]|uniref:hypothetical protein n=1 Tax=Bradyrhizobium sp. cf659 TaxID=1761771 RepID=UPI0008F1ACB1|nr:hypothetical protein [Bradyrhizobium sp. cf659]SFK01671.1 hypothetical protein SAMN04487925_11533 [Bradyrhizobium sp. cf659]